MVRSLRLLLVILLAGCASSAPQQPLRVLVYNIHAGRDAAGVDNLERVAALIRETRADLVLLQEVDRGTARSGGVDQLDVLTRRTGLHGVFGKSLDYQGGEYGIAILSRWPVSGSEIVPLRVDPPQARAGGAIEPRVALVIETETTAGRLTILNTHLDASGAETYRLQETEEVLRTLRRRPVDLAGGDFNAEPRSRVYAQLTGSGLRDAWIDCGAGAGLTFSAAAPVKRIDYLFLGPRARCTSAAVLESDASDHRPVLVQVTVER
ncbi:MAG TPA: endonuclease/exonuclease/phosphatase family protein [Thermoanaerobaculia bacterium]|nr:endonuclease/exonuclease/phosphatase family protein [Thermoanaerobaculia bacterium]